MHNTFVAEHKDKHCDDGIDECHQEKGLMGLGEEVVRLCFFTELHVHDRDLFLEVS
jgi:hypothetical protein